MSDLVKILVSATVGMIIGIIGSIIGEPLRLSAKKRKIEKALCAELDYWYEECQKIAAYEDPKEICEKMFEALKTDAFDHYFDKDREAVFAIKNWQKLRESFSFLFRTQEEFKNNKIEVDDAAAQIASYLETGVGLNYLKKEKLAVVADYLERAKSNRLIR